MLTGRYPWRLGSMRSNFIPWSRPDGLRPDFDLLPRRLGGGGGSSTGVGRGVAVWTGGTAVVTGNFYGTASSGATRLAAAGSFDVFVARIGAGGSV